MTIFSQGLHVAKEYNITLFNRTEQKLKIILNLLSFHAKT